MTPEEKIRKNPRLPDYDYHNGWFFVTNRTNFRRPYLVNNFYDIVKTELFNLPKKYPGVEIDFFSIMPSHIHAILLFDDVELPLFEIWRRFKAVTTKTAHETGLSDKTLWQEGFYEHIVRNEKALERIRKYIYNNPLKVDLPLDEIYFSKEDYYLIVH